MAQPFNLTANVTFQSANLGSFINQVKSSLNRAATTIPVNLGINRQQLQAGAAAVGVIATQAQQVDRQVRKADASAKTFGSTLVGRFRTFAQFTIVSRIIGTLVSGFSTGVREALNFQRAIVQVGQVTGAGTNELQRLSNTITNLSTSLGVSSAQLVEISRTLSQTGLAGRDLESALSALARSQLSPTFSNIQNTTEGLIATFGQFSRSAQESEQILASISAVAARFPVSADDLIVAIQKAGGAFSAAGGNLNELLGLFTAVRGTTRESANSIATGIRNITVRLQRLQNTEALQRLGIDLRNAQGEFVGVFEAVDRLNRGLAGVSSRSADFTGIAEQLGGLRQISRFLPLIQEFQKARLAATTASRATTLENDVVKGQQALLNTLTKVKEEFISLFRDAINSDEFRILTDNILLLTKALAGLLRVLGPAIPALASLGLLRLFSGPGFGRLTGLGSTFRAFGGGGTGGAPPTPPPSSPTPPPTPPIAPIIIPGGPSGGGGGASGGFGRRPFGGRPFGFGPGGPGNFTFTTPTSNFTLFGSGGFGRAAGNPDFTRAQNAQRANRVANEIIGSQRLRSFLQAQIRREVRSEFRRFPRFAGDRGGFLRFRPPPDEPQQPVARPPTRPPGGGGGFSGLGAGFVSFTPPELPQTTPSGGGSPGGILGPVVSGVLLEPISLQSSVIADSIQNKLIRLLNDPDFFAGSEPFVRPGTNIAGGPLSTINSPSQASIPALKRATGASDQDIRALRKLGVRLNPTSAPDQFPPADIPLAVPGLGDERLFLADKPKTPIPLARSNVVPVALQAAVSESIQNQLIRLIQDPNVFSARSSTQVEIPFLRRQTGATEQDILSLQDRGLRLSPTSTTAGISKADLGLALEGFGGRRNIFFVDKPSTPIQLPSETAGPTASGVPVPQLSSQATSNQQLLTSSQNLSQSFIATGQSVESFSRGVTGLANAFNRTVPGAVPVPSSIAAFGSSKDFIRDVVKEVRNIRAVSLATEQGLVPSDRNNTQFRGIQTQALNTFNKQIETILNQTGARFSEVVRRAGGTFGPRRGIQALTRLPDDVQQSFRLLRQVLTSQGGEVGALTATQVTAIQGLPIQQALDRIVQRPPQGASETAATRPPAAIQSPQQAQQALVGLTSSAKKAASATNAQATATSKGTTEVSKITRAFFNARNVAAAAQSGAFGGGSGFVLRGPAGGGGAGDRIPNFQTVGGVRSGGPLVVAGARGGPVVPSGTRIIDTTFVGNPQGTGTFSSPGTGVTSDGVGLLPTGRGGSRGLRNLVRLRRTGRNLRSGFTSGFGSALSTSFLAPILGNLIAQAIRPDLSQLDFSSLSVGQRQSLSTQAGISGIFSGAGAGAGLGGIAGFAGGLAFGAATGTSVGPIGTIVGATLGAIIGAVNGFIDEQRKTQLAIRDSSIGVAAQDFVDALNKIAKGATTAAETLGRARDLTTQLVEGADLQKINIQRGNLADISRAIFKEQGTFETLQTPAVERIISERRRFLSDRRREIQGLEQFIGLRANEVVADLPIETLESLEGGGKANQQLFDETAKRFIDGFSSTIDLIAEAQQIDANKLREQFRTDLEQAQLNRRRKIAEASLIASVERLNISFSDLEGAITFSVQEAATQSFSPTLFNVGRNQGTNLPLIFGGINQDVFSDRFRTDAIKLSSVLSGFRYQEGTDIGRRRTQTDDGVPIFPLEEAVGPLDRLATQAITVQSVSRELPGVISSLTARGLEGEKLSQSLEKQLQTLLAGDDKKLDAFESELLETITQRVSNIKVDELFARALRPDKLSRDLLSGLDGSVVVIRQLASTFQDAISRFATGLGQLNQRISDNLRLADTINFTQLDVERQQAAIRGSGLSSERLNAPLLERVNRLRGSNVPEITGNNVFGIPRLIRSAANGAIRRIRSIRSVLESSGSGREPERAAELVNTENELSNLIAALRSLADVTRNSAGFQERLVRLQERANTFGGIGANLVTGSREDVSDISRTIFDTLSSVATGQLNGGLSQQAAERRTDVLELLGRFGQREIAGRRADLIIQELTSNFLQRQGFDKETADVFAGVLGGEGDRIQQDLINVSRLAVEAQKQLFAVNQQLNNTIRNDLVNTLSNLIVSLNKNVFALDERNVRNRLTDKKSELDSVLGFDDVRKRFLRFIDRRVPNVDLSPENISKVNLDTIRNVFQASQQFDDLRPLVRGRAAFGDLSNLGASLGALGKGLFSSEDVLAKFLTDLGRGNINQKNLDSRLGFPLTSEQRASVFTGKTNFEQFRRIIGLVPGLRQQDQQLLIGSTQRLFNARTGDVRRPGPDAALFFDPEVIKGIQENLDQRIKDTDNFNLLERSDSKLKTAPLVIRLIKLLDAAQQGQFSDERVTFFSEAGEAFKKFPDDVQAASKKIAELTETVSKLKIELEQLQTRNENKIPDLQRRSGEILRTLPDPPALGQNRGGKIPGFGTRDTIPAMLTKGEFVVNARDTRKNLSLLEAVNRGEVQGFQNGGLVQGQVFRENLTSSEEEERLNNVNKGIANLSRRLNLGDKPDTTQQGVNLSNTIENRVKAEKQTEFFETLKDRYGSRPIRARSRKASDNLGNELLTLDELNLIPPTDVLRKKLAALGVTPRSGVILNSQFFSRTGSALGGDVSNDRSVELYNGLLKSLTSPSRRSLRLGLKDIPRLSTRNVGSDKDSALFLYGDASATLFPEMSINPRVDRVPLTQRDIVRRRVSTLIEKMNINRFSILDRLKRDVSDGLNSPSVVIRQIFKQINRLPLDYNKVARQEYQKLIDDITDGLLSGNVDFVSGDKLSVAGRLRRFTQNEKDLANVLPEDFKNTVRDSKPIFDRVIPNVGYGRTGSLGANIKVGELNLRTGKRLNKFDIEGYQARLAGFGQSSVEETVQELWDVSGRVLDYTEFRKHIYNGLSYIPPKASSFSSDAPLDFGIGFIGKRLPGENPANFLTPEERGILEGSVVSGDLPLAAPVVGKQNFSYDSNYIKQRKEIVERLARRMGRKPKTREELVVNKDAEILRRNFYNMGLVDNEQFVTRAMSENGLSKPFLKLVAQHLSAEKARRPQLTAGRLFSKIDGGQGSFNTDLLGLEIAINTGRPGFPRPLDLPNPGNIHRPDEFGMVNLERSDGSRARVHESVALALPININRVRESFAKGLQKAEPLSAPDPEGKFPSLLGKPLTVRGLRDRGFTELAGFIGGLQRSTKKEHNDAARFLLSDGNLANQIRDIRLGRNPRLAELTKEKTRLRVLQLAQERLDANGFNIRVQARQQRQQDLFKKAGELLGGEPQARLGQGLGVVGQLFPGDRPTFPGRFGIRSKQEIADQNITRQVNKLVDKVTGGDRIQDLSGFERSFLREHIDKSSAHFDDRSRIKKLLSALPPRVPQVPQPPQAQIPNPAAKQSKPKRKARVLPPGVPGPNRFRKKQQPLVNGFRVRPGAEPLVAPEIGGGPQIPGKPDRDLDRIQRNFFQLGLAGESIGFIGDLGVGQPLDQERLFKIANLLKAKGLPIPGPFPSVLDGDKAFLGLEKKINQSRPGFFTFSELRNGRNFLNPRGKTKVIRNDGSTVELENSIATGFPQSVRVLRDLQSAIAPLFSLEEEETARFGLKGDDKEKLNLLISNIKTSDNLLLKRLLTEKLTSLDVRRNGIRDFQQFRQTLLDDAISTGVVPPTTEGFGGLPLGRTPEDLATLSFAVAIEQQNRARRLGIPALDLQKSDLDAIPKKKPSLIPSEESVRRRKLGDSFKSNTINNIIKRINLDSTEFSDITENEFRFLFKNHKLNTLGEEFKERKSAIANVVDRYTDPLEYINAVKEFLKEFPGQEGIDGPIFSDSKPKTRKPIIDPLLQNLGKPNKVDAKDPFQDAIRNPPGIKGFGPGNIPGGIPLKPPVRPGVDDPNKPLSPFAGGLIQKGPRKGFPRRLTIKDINRLKKAGFSGDAIREEKQRIQIARSILATGLDLSDEELAAQISKEKSARSRLRPFTTSQRLDSGRAARQKDLDRAKIIDGLRAEQINKLVDGPEKEALFNRLRKRNNEQFRRQPTEDLNREEINKKFIEESLKIRRRRGGGRSISDVSGIFSVPGSTLDDDERLRRQRNVNDDLFRTRGRRFQQGGFVGDFVPALLNRGEFVLNPQAVRQAGVSNLNRLNGTGNVADQAPGQERITEFNTEAISQLSQAIVTFSTSGERLAQAMEAFPRQINMDATHTVNVNVTGAEALASIGNELGELATSKAREEINRMIGQFFPDLGSFSE